MSLKLTCKNYMTDLKCKSLQNRNFIRHCNKMFVMLKSRNVDSETDFECEGQLLLHTLVSLAEFCLVISILLSFFLNP